MGIVGTIKQPLAPQKLCRTLQASDINSRNVNQRQKNDLKQILNAIFDVRLAHQQVH